MAKYLSNKHGEVNVKIGEINAFSNDSFNGFEIGWLCELGWGSCTFLFNNKDEGGVSVTIESECMANNENKGFVAALLEEMLTIANIAG